MDFVVVESPFASGEIVLADGSVYKTLQEGNIAYARACLYDCLVRYQEAPYASHLLYTQPGVLDDEVPAERRLGIEAGFEIAQYAKRRVFYLDRGFSTGMRWGLQVARDLGQPCEIRRLGGPWDVGFDPHLSLEDLLSSLRG